MQQRQPEAEQFGAGYQKLARGILAVMAWRPPAAGKNGEGSGETGLRDQAKNAWIYLAIKAGGFSRTVYTSNASIGAAIGGTPWKGRRAIEALLGQGLIELRPGRFRGEFPVYLCDPQSAAIARQARVESGSDQGVFPFPDDPNSRSEEDGGPGEATTLPLASAAGRRPGPQNQSAPAGDNGTPAQQIADQRSDPQADQLIRLRMKALDPQSPHRPCISTEENRSSTINHLHGKWEHCGSEVSSARGEPGDLAAEKKALERRGEPADVVDTTATLADSLAGAIDRFTARQDQAPGAELPRLQRWLDHIQSRVNDPLLGRFRDGKTSQSADQMLRRIAWALVERDLYQRHLEEAFAALDYHCRHNQVRSRAAFFMGIMKRLFRERGLDWGRPSAGPVDRASPDLAAGSSEAPLP